VADVEAAGGVAGVAAKLGTSTSAGLPPGMVPTLRACFGDNRLPPKRRKWWLEHFAESITDLTLMILMAGAIITIAFGATTNRQEDQITGELSFPPFPPRTPSDSSPLSSPSSPDPPFLVADVPHAHLHSHYTALVLRLRLHYTAVALRCEIFTALTSPANRATPHSHTRPLILAGGAILMAVGVVSLVTSTVNYVQEGQFTALAKVKEDRSVTVVRGGEELDVSVFDVVVGDLFVVRAGELLPCDGLLVTGSGIKTDESAMTGESLEIPKSVDGDRFLIGGSQVTAGAGRMLVTTVGEDTSYGVIVKALESIEPPPTPLQEKLSRLAKRIGYMGMALGVFLLCILIILYFAVPSRQDADTSRAVTILSFFLLSITIVVVAVPEGLPMAVVLSLAFSMKRMIKDRVLVRKLNACETMGSATCICSDKTGTLTQNRMTVTAGLFYGAVHTASVPSARDLGPGLSGSAAAGLLAFAVALNSDANVRGSGASVEFSGNKTEGALLHALATAFSLDYAAVRRAAAAAAGRADNTFDLHRENFNSRRKRMTTVVAADVFSRAAAAVLGADVAETLCGPAGALARARGGGAVVLTKGASEVLVRLCATEAVPRTGPDGSGVATVALTADRRDTVASAVTDLARRGLRTLGVAVGALSAADVARVEALVGTTQAPPPGSAAGAAPVLLRSTGDAWEWATEAGWLDGGADGLALVAVAGIRDPPRPEVPAAVAACKRALVRVRMVTGDNVETARAIAKEVGIDTGGTVMEGTEWRALTPERRREVVVGLDVLARAIPTDKLLLVQALQDLGEVVAVTGDGSNDAPALNAAHVGCAMGIAGTEVAKEAADLVILDDNFASIVNAILWGRAVLENIRKFLSFQLVVNVSSCLLTVIMALVEGGAATSFPLTPIQLLWINLIMDSFAALALATEPPDPSLLRHRPEGRKSPLLSPIMRKMIAGQSVFQTALLLFMTLSQAGADMFDPALAGAAYADPAYARGGRMHLVCVFNSFVFMTIFNKFNARKLHDDQWNVFKGLFHSVYAPGIMVAIFFLQAIIVEFGTRAVMQTVPLNWAQWLVCVAVGLTTLPIGFLLRFFPTPDPTLVSEEEAAAAARSPRAAAFDPALHVSATPVAIKVDGAAADGEVPRAKSVRVVPAAGDSAVAPGASTPPA
jgi:Ca2+-transporting ATPase